MTFTVTSMPAFEVVSPFSPAGDQPAAIEALVNGARAGLRHMCLEGITGSGKTATIAWTIEQLGRPTLIIEPNKSLAAQLAGELKELLPNNRVEFFVSYYDYYQPEAYVASSDTLIEKESSINKEIERLRHSATAALLTRRDTVVVASVSCIYALGDPAAYRAQLLTLDVGTEPGLKAVARHLVDLQYARNDAAPTRGQFRVKGDTMEIYPADTEYAVVVSFFDETIEKIAIIDPLNRTQLAAPTSTTVFAASHHVASPEAVEKACASIRTELTERLAELEDQGKVLEAHRLTTRTELDLETLETSGFCSGIENYSRHMDGRAPGQRPYTLLDYFPDDFLVVVDEAHVAIPQLRGQSAGDRARKQNLVDHGFRLPSSLDNRPLTFDEFMTQVPQLITVTATPGPFDRAADLTVPQVLRPTGLLDPEVVVVGSAHQIDDLQVRITERVERHERVLVTTMTKKMAEELTDYLARAGVKVRYLHSDVDTIERIAILRDLRLGVFDVLVGINLLREGLDLPEVSLVAILDADKEGFLRSYPALLQTIGRAARHASGTAVLYADKVTDSMRAAIDTTAQRRALQQAHNLTHGIEPATVTRAVTDLLAALTPTPPSSKKQRPTRDALLSQIGTEVADLEAAMNKAAGELRFEEAAVLRDLIATLRAEAATLEAPEPVGPQQAPDI